MPYSNHRSGRSCRGAFTLIELLIVIGIITILIVLGMSVAGKVTATGKIRATEQTLRCLDLALTALTQENGGRTPPPWVIDPRPGNNMSMYVQPIIDGRCGTTNEIVNSVGLFLVQCKSSPAAMAALKNINSRYVHEYTPDTAAGATFDLQPSIPTVFDAWDHPIRYVHPAGKGLIADPYADPHAMPTPTTTAVNTTDVLGLPPTGHGFGITQIRRNHRIVQGDSVDHLDADGGIGSAALPYFYSLGPDGQAGYEYKPTPDALGYPIVNNFNADNVYLNVPRWINKQPTEHLK